MTKKDYEAFAKAFAEHIRYMKVTHTDGATEYGEHSQKLLCANMISYICTKFNSNFDRVKFFKACGLTNA